MFLSPLFSCLRLPFKMLYYLYTCHTEISSNFYTSNQKQKQKQSTRGVTIKPSKLNKIGLITAHGSLSFVPLTFNNITTTNQDFTPESMVVFQAAETVSDQACIWGKFHSEIHSIKSLLSLPKPAIVL